MPSTATRCNPAIESPVDAWFEVVGASDSLVQPVVRGLGERGVQLCSRDPVADRPRNGVVVFAGSAAAAADSIHAVADGGSERILALAANGGELGDDSWGLLRAGASDVLSWCDAESSARQVAERLRRWQTIDELVECAHVQEFLVGESPAWRAVLRDAVEVARFTEAAVLITGESGTGKERVAQLIHELDPRPNKRRLVVLDCSTVVPSLSGSEFFGHEKGAFTGASAAREGAFELAHGSTLFLDEVGELPAPLQAELLRVIQEGTFKRVGSNTWRKSSFRLICATNRDLADEQAKGAFRNDFYYRIAGCTLHLPSLRERREDILPLFHHFFREAHPEGRPPELEDAVRELLVSRPYPGNVRDLRSLALRIVHRYLGAGVVSVGDIPDCERPAPAPQRTPWRDGDFAHSIRRAVAQGATPAEIAAAAADVASVAARG
ncbi:sigma 54-interacting transcriptional regulator [Solirubrobacter ginsenosidimutans]|uniref:Sigma 54-interacting transcriptional regulator n=1 Tax=Solirubrobacter ginsenosidimutans TaxID=490573 RepID=A0A9X3MTC1_9ACTN|nr:sigma 54-interacting transcriptional regulator [Solirubrobacter ginsenosidimutans]MDA0160878.1 sigma 54-interacting transcriptional regulator [Solirubrobacter ginsenosidimutans]